MTETQRFETLRLTAGEAELLLVPAAGGAIAAWRVGGQSMLHESGVQAGPGWDPLAMASFPLVPFSNRIGGGCFCWDGAEYRLPPSALPDRHAIHGTGWRSAWQVVQSGSDHAVLRHDHRGGDAWPWPYAAEQHFRLTAHGLAVTLRVTNGAGAPVPLAIGLHPYFDASGAHLKFAAAHIWHSGADMLPTHVATPTEAEDFSPGRRVADTRLDHGFDGWDGRAAIWWDERPLALDMTSDLPCAVVYSPPGEAYFCFEPVPHSIDALHLDGAGQPMPVAGPGEAVAAFVRFDAVPRGAVA